MILNKSIDVCRNTTSSEVSSQLAYSQADPQNVRNNEGTISKKVTFGDLVRTESDDFENREQQSDREASAILGSNTASTTTTDDLNSSFSPFLTPVLEEPSSSFSEGLHLLNSVYYCFERGLVVTK